MIVNWDRASRPQEAWQLVGNTPLIRLPHFEKETSGVELYAKAEWFNPGGSVKDPEVIAAADRLGMAMVFTGMRHFLH